MSSYYLLTEAGCGPLFVAPSTTSHFDNCIFSIFHYFGRPLMRVDFLSYEELYMGIFLNTGTL